MLFSFNLAAVLGLLAVVNAAPSTKLHKHSLSKRDCITGLTQSDCDYVRSLKMNPGANAASGPNGIWIGSDGPTKVQFTNDAPNNEAIILVIWTKSNSATNKRSNDSSIIPAGFLEEYNGVTPVPTVTWSLAHDETVTVSMANSVSAGWAALYNQQTGLTTGNGGGQIDNTWGEITTYIPGSQYSQATTDVSRLVNMNGNTMTITVKDGEKPGCISDMTRCSYTCQSSPTKCTDGGSMADCQASDQVPGAQVGPGTGGFDGGCQGFNSGGFITVSFS